MEFTNQFSDQAGNRKENFIRGLASPDQLSGLFNIALQFLDILNSTKKFTFALTPDEVGELYKKRSDSAALFIETRIRYNPGAQISKPDLMEAYQLFCQDEGLMEETPKSFKAALDHSGIYYGEGQKDLVRFWKGLELKPEEENAETTPKEKIPDSWPDFLRYYEKKVNLVTPLTALTGFFSNCLNLAKNEGDIKDKAVIPVIPVIETSLDNPTKTEQDGLPSNLLASNETNEKVASNETTLTLASSLTLAPNEANDTTIQDCQALLAKMEERTIYSPGLLRSTMGWDWDKFNKIIQLLYKSSEVKETREGWERTRFDVIE
jgi:hypothetical protein